MKKSIFFKILMCHDTYSGAFKCICVLVLELMLVLRIEGNTGLNIWLGVSLRVEHILQHIEKSLFIAAVFLWFIELEL